MKGEFNNEFENFNEFIMTFRTLVEDTNLKWWFRGQKNKEWNLEPGIYRGYTNEDERCMNHDFYRKTKTIRPNCPANTEYAAWLTLMQHYGLPTRLLDWSRSPLIACFFATQDWEDYQTDASIWALCPSRLNEQFSFGSHLYPMDKDTVRDLLVPAFHNTPVSNKVIACWAVEYDIRVYVQQSAFTVHDCTTPLNKLSGNDTWLKQYIIPAYLKAEFNNTLKALGFDISDVYPDLEHIAMELK